MKAVIRCGYVLAAVIAAASGASAEDAVGNRNTVAAVTQTESVLPTCSLSFDAIGADNAGKKPELLWVKGNIVLPSDAEAGAAGSLILSVEIQRSRVSEGEAPKWQLAPVDKIYLATDDGKEALATDLPMTPPGSAASLTVFKINAKMKAVLEQMRTRHSAVLKILRSTKRPAAVIPLDFTVVTVDGKTHRSDAAIKTFLECGAKHLAAIAAQPAG